MTTAPATGLTFPSAGKIVTYRPTADVHVTQTSRQASPARFGPLAAFDDYISGERRRSRDDTSEAVGPASCPPGKSLRVAKHNLGSIRVVEKCGFSVEREESVELAGKNITEFMLVLR